MFKNLIFTNKGFHFNHNDNEKISNLITPVRKKDLIFDEDSLVIYFKTIFQFKKYKL